MQPEYDVKELKKIMRPSLGNLHLAAESSVMVRASVQQYTPAQVEVIQEELRKDTRVQIVCVQEGGLFVQFDFGVEKVRAQAIVHQTITGLNLLPGVELKCPRCGASSFSAWDSPCLDAGKCNTADRSAAQLGKVLDFKKKFDEQVQTAWGRFTAQVTLEGCSESKSAPGQWSLGFRDVAGNETGFTFNDDGSCLGANIEVMLLSGEVIVAPERILDTAWKDAYQWWCQ